MAPLPVRHHSAGCQRPQLEVRASSVPDRCRALPSKRVAGIQGSTYKSSDAPALATRWNASRDGLVWSFTLREGVRFHDGSPLTSLDVAISFERQLRPDVQTAGRAWPALLRGAPGVMKEVRAPNARTVEIVLAQPYAALLTVLAHPGLAVAKYSTTADGAGRFVGTGPYRV